MSIDWKISTGIGNPRDFDKDLPHIQWASDGLHQYYELEQQTDLCSMNSWKVLEKIGINNPQKLDKTPVDFVIIDNAPHITEEGMKNMIQKSARLFIVTSNKNHPAFSLQESLLTLNILYYENEIDFWDVFSSLKNNFGIDGVTIQTWWELNSYFLRNNFIDALSIIVAPCLVWWKETPTLVDGASLELDDNLVDIKTFRLTSVDILKDSYIHLRYDRNSK